MSKSRIGFRPGRIVASVLAAAFVLEAALQVGAFALWRRRGPDDTDARGGRTVLCVGDSYTAGMAATSSDRTYPAALESRLRRSGDPSWRVVNGGWPGRDSGEVLRCLPAQIEATRPAFVCALFGANDSWARPARQRLSAATPRATLAPRFPWRWRTARLVAPVAGFFARQTPRDVPSARPTRPPPGEPAAAPSSSERARRDRLAGEAWVALAEGAVESALSRFDAILAEDPNHVGAGEGRIDCLALLGRRDEARAMLATLEERFAGTREVFLAEAILASLARLGEMDAAIRLARETIARFPERSRAHEILALETARKGDHASAAEAIERAVLLDANASAPRRADLQHSRSIVYARIDPDRSTESLVAAFLLKDDDAYLARALRRDRPTFTSEQLERWLARLDAPAGARERIERIAREVAEGSESWKEVLESHLRELVAHCRSRDARPLLLTYPFLRPEMDEVVRRVASETGTPIVDTLREFDRLRQTKAWDDLFVPNGHCTDEGYATIARLVEEAIVGIDAGGPAPSAPAGVVPDAPRR